MAVPALRVLEDKEGGNGKKIKKNVKGGVFVKGSGISIPDSEDGTVIDVIDERGFVDGVKVARKCSKANVLGKAVEYIRVLKKRENRLKAEQAGLKTLVAGLVGGAALLKEWEREWRQRFGGEEKDEVEGDDVEGDDEESDEEDVDDGDEELGRKRKRPKFPGVPKKAVAERKTSTPATGGDSGVPEKRKRGRPRKVVPPPATAPTVVPPLVPPPQIQPLKTQDQTMLSSQEQWMQVHQQQQQSQPQQYLLAVFALFSFFNSPLTSSSSPASGHHQHTGTVLTSLHPPLAYAPEIISQFAAPSSSPVSGADAWGWKEYVQMFHLFVSIVVLASCVLSWAGITLGIGRTRRSRSVSFTPPNVGAKKRRKEEVVDWVSVGDECILAGKCLHLFSLILTRTNVMILRKLALRVIIHPLESLPRYFPPAVVIHRLHQLTRYARLWCIRHSRWPGSSKSAFFMGLCQGTCFVSRPDYPWHQETSAGIRGPRFRIYGRNRGC